MSESKEKGLSIFYRLMFAFLASNLLVVTLAGGIYFFYAKGTLEDFVTHHLSDSQHEASSYFSQVYEAKVASQLSLLAANPSLQNCICDEMDMEHLQRDMFEQQLVRISEEGDSFYHSLRGIDAAGMERVVVENARPVQTYSSVLYPLPDNPVGQAVLLLFRKLQAAEPGAILAVGPFTDKKNRLGFVAGISITTPEEPRFNGVLIAHCDLSDFITFLSGITIHKMESIWLLDQNNEVLSTLSESEQAPFDLSGSNVNAEVFSAVVQCRFGSSKEVLFKIAAKAPENIFADQMGALANRAIIIILCGFLFSFAVAYLLSKQFAKPIVDFVHLSSEISRGNFNVAFQTKTGGEFAELAASFNQMTRKLLQLIKSRDKEIESRRQAEKALLEEHDRLATITKSIGAGLAIVSREYRILWANEVFTDLFGDTVGKVCYRVKGEAAICDCCGVRDIFEKGEDVVVTECARRDEHGKQMWHEIIATPIFDGKGSVVSALELIIPITERKEVEEKIQGAKEEWENTFDAITDYVCIFDLNHRVTRANRAAANLFKCEPAALVGKHCYELFEKRSTPCSGCPVSLCIADQQSHATEFFHDYLGKLFWVSASPLFDRQGKVQAIVHFSKDITEQRRMESRIRQAQKMEAIGTLSGGIAHDFNNILTPIIGFSELVLDELPEGTPAWENQQEVILAGKRAQKLVRQILAFSRQVEQEVVLLQPHLIVKESLKLLRASLPTTIAIKQSVKVCGAVQADPTQIHQVVMNLCTNAFHAMRDTGGVLTVSLEAVEVGAEDEKVIAHELSVGRYVRLGVSDTGKGMDRLTLERIFEPYFTTKASGEGTGLGLSVVHGVVENCGGHISVTSEIGEGTTFYVYLPQVDPQAAAEQIENELKILPRGNESVLVVDDEEKIVQVEKRVLESLGYRVSLFTSPEKALQAFAEEPQRYDLVITDMTMPNLTGADLARKIFEVRAEMPIILCTGFSELIDEERAKEIGLRAFIMKPLIKKNIARIVRKVLDEKS